MVFVATTMLEQEQCQGLAGDRRLLPIPDRLVVKGACPMTRAGLLVAIWPFLGSSFWSGGVVVVQIQIFYSSWC